MPLKIQILEIVEGQKIIDQGADSQRVETTFHAWVQEPKPRRYKINLAKASADELNQWRLNVGGEILTDIGEMTQNGKLALYFVPHSEIEVLKTPEQLQAFVHLGSFNIDKVKVYDKSELKPEPVTDSKSDIKESMPPMGSNAGSRPAQPTR